MSRTQESGYTAGIDVGGTKVFVCVADPQGNPVIKSKLRTPTESDPESFFRWLFEELALLLVERGLQVYDLSGIGVGFPGVIGDNAGILTNAPAFRWPATDVRPIIRKYYTGSVYLDNDVNMAAWGENWMGAAQGKRHVMMITIGTGIGSAFIFNGELYKGANNAAGEIGNWVVDSCLINNEHGKGEKFGPFEEATSGTGIGIAARDYLSQGGRKSKILEMAGGILERIEAKHVVTAAAEGDETAKKIMDRPLNYMAVGIANAVSLLNPEVVVLGGGVVDSGDYYVNEVRDRASKLTPLPVNIVLATLGNEAGAYGAIAAARLKEELHQKKAKINF